MLKAIGLTLCVLCMSVMQSVAQDSVFFYNNEARVYFHVDTTQISVKWAPFEGDLSASGYLDSYPSIEAVNTEFRTVSGFHLHKLVTRSSYENLLTDLKTDSNVLRVSPVLKTSDNKSLYIGDEVGCRLSDPQDSLYLYQFCHKNDIEIVDLPYPPLPGTYLLRLSGNCRSSTIDIANRLWERTEFKWSQPNCSGLGELFGYMVSDEHFWNGNQWNVKSAVNYESTSNYGAWEITRGRPEIKITVMDQGMEWHEDFDTANFEDGFNFFPGGLPFPWPVWPEPDTVYESHGMHVLGLISALHNNPVNQVQPPGHATGSEFASTVGVAPGCEIMPMRMINEHHIFPSDFWLGMAFTIAGNYGTHIINCSWGYNEGYFPDPVRDAIDDLLINGRDGKGTIVVAAIGNSPDRTKYPAAMDSVISVGSINEADNPIPSNPTGSYVDLLAPSVTTSWKDPNSIWAVDRMSDWGANPKLRDDCEPTNDMDYACSFGGTSAAAPLVTGIIGLLLSVDSNLTRDHVQEIIRASAIRDLEIVVDTTNPEHIERYGYGRLSGVRALSTVLRGDVNGNQMINIGDLTYLEDYLYHGGPEPYPNRIFGDVNCSGTVNMSDMTYLINYLYSQGPPPPCPCIQFGD